MFWHFITKQQVLRDYEHPRALTYGSERIDTDSRTSLPQLLVLGYIAPEGLKSEFISSSSFQQLRVAHSPSMAGGKRGETEINTWHKYNKAG